MRNFLKIGDVDTTALTEQLSAHPELWDANRQRKDRPASPHAQMSDIWVRFNDVAACPDLARLSDPHVPVWYPAYAALPALKPILMSLMAQVGGEMLGGVLITKIAPGAGIQPHRDKSWHVDYYEKFYVSVQSAPGAVFGCEEDGVREELEPKSGEVWLFDNHKLHWVENRSGIDRITLIVCIRRFP